MPTITFTQPTGEATEVTVEEGTSLMRAAVTNGIEGIVGAFFAGLGGFGLGYGRGFGRHYCSLGATNGSNGRSGREFGCKKGVRKGDPAKTTLLLYGG